MKYLAFITCLLCIFSAKGQINEPGTYTEFTSYSSIHQDVFSFTGNQASLANIKYSGAGVFGEKRFMLNELGNYFFAIALPTSSGNFGLEANYTGSSGFNQTKIGLAYARNLGKKINVGTQFNYNGIAVAGYGNDAAVSFEAGVIYLLTEKLNAGIHVNNPIGGKFGKEGVEKLPSVFHFGMGFDASEKLFFTAVIIKEEEQPVNINAGLQYKFYPFLYARVGVATATATMWSGIGLAWQNIKCDLISSFHPQLGWTPGIMLCFDFKKKEN